MEKRKPSYDLNAIKAAIGTADTLSIKKALSNATSLGFDIAGIAEVISQIDRRMFIKSMTTFADYKVWQDVYYVPAGGFIIYVKFQRDILTEFSVVSFKEK